MNGEDRDLGMGRDISRRDFVTLSVAASVALATGTTADAAVAVVEENVTIKTQDGTCDAAFIHPTTGAHPAVLIWPDAFGLRPVMREIGKRIAGEGYSVLVPNPFYRVAKAPVFDDPSKFNFANDADNTQRAEIRIMQSMLDKKTSEKPSEEKR